MKTNNSTNENWEKEFDELTAFLEILPGHGIQILPVKETDRESVRVFIRSLLSQEKKALLDSVMEEVRIFNINAGNRSISEWKIEGIINNLRKDI